MVLRSAADDVPAALRAEVDEALLQALATHTRFSAMVGSPIPFEDVELAAGCRARDTDCMRRISATLGDDWFMIRELRRDPAGRVYVTLTAHDGPHAELTRRAVAEVTLAGAHAPDRVLPGAIDQIYAEQLVAPTAARAPATAHEELLGAQPEWASSHAEGPTATQPKAERAQRPASPPARESVNPAGAALGWTATAVGGGLLAAGTVMSVLSQRDHRTYRNAAIQTEQDVQWADDLLDRARDRARTANLLLISGAATGAAGVATLLWTYFRPRPSRDVRSVALQVAPAHAGASLAVRGQWRGGL